MAELLSDDALAAALTELDGWHLVEGGTAIEAEFAEGSQPDYSDWWNQLNRLRETYPLGYDLPEDGSLSPQYVIERLGALSGPDSIYAAGVGQHQMWAAQFVGYERPGTWLNYGGLGTMGFAVPAAMGA